MQDGIEYLLREARPGDAILTIGAGNVSRALDELALLLGTKVTTRACELAIPSCIARLPELGVELRPAFRSRRSTSLGIGGTTTKSFCAARHDSAS